MKNKCTAISLVWESGIIKNVLKPTCEILQDYCSEIVVAHCGPKDQLYLYDEYENVKVIPYDYKGNAVDVLWHLISQVPKGEWALLLDSDHRPSPELLENLDNSISFMNENNYDVAAIPTHHHEYNGNNVSHSGYPPPSTFVAGTYVVYNLFKVTDNLKINNNQGMHYAIVNNNIYYLPYCMNHLKLYFEYFASIFLCGYSNPTVHSFSDREKMLDTQHFEVYNQFKELKEKFNMPTSNEFKSMAYKHNVPQEIIEFFSNPNFCKENNPNTTGFLDHAYKFCTKYGFSMDESMIHNRYCGSECCKYKNRQL